MEKTIRSCVEKILDTKYLNPYITHFSEKDMKDQYISNKGSADEQRSLEGIIVGVKDNFNLKHSRCTAGSHMLKEYVSPYDATVIRKLRDLGCVFSGKTNLDEFAMGTTSQYSGFDI